MVPRLLLTGVAILAAWTLLHGLGAGSLHDWDEAAYGEIAREMVQSHDWTTPHFNEVPVFDKPPLMMWLMGLGLSAHLPDELAVRLPSALAGLVAVALTGWLGLRMFGWTAGAAAALLLLIGSWNQRTFPGLARHGMLDVPLTATMVWAMLHFWLGLRNSRHWLLIGVPLGIGAMVKSLAVAPLVAVIVLGAVLVRFTGAPLARQHWYALGGGLLIAALLALPWYLVEAARYGQPFVQGALLTHLSRTTEVQEGNAGDWRFYLRVLHQGLPRWWWLTLPALGLATWHLVRTRDVRALLLILWVLTPFAVFASAATKLPWYIMPIYPALALLAAWLLQQLAPARPPTGGLLVATLLVLVAVKDARSNWLDDRSWAEKRLGLWVQRMAAPAETIAFFTHTDLDGPATLLQQPSVRFYANRHMDAVGNREQVARWLADDGRVVWSDTLVVRELAGLIVPVARAGDQQLSGGTARGKPAGGRMLRLQRPAQCGNREPFAEETHACPNCGNVEARRMVLIFSTFAGETGAKQAHGRHAAKVQGMLAPSVAKTASPSARVPLSLRRHPV
jgi:hypothetical protein